jgi:hypothetical protein
MYEFWPSFSSSQGDTLMPKYLTAALALLAGIILSSALKTSANPVPPLTPLIVAKGKVLNQNAPVPTTTIYTPTQDGLFRLSVYGTVSQIDTVSNVFWDVKVSWTDSSGPTSVSGFCFTENGDATAQPFFWNAEGFSGAPVILQAKAGEPITFAVAQTGGTIGNGAYSIYYTLERLE